MYMKAPRGGTLPKNTHGNLPDKLLLIPNQHKETYYIGSKNLPVYRLGNYGMFEDGSKPI
jgi:hypothetical protein